MHKESPGPKVHDDDVVVPVCKVGQVAQDDVAHARGLVGPQAADAGALGHM